MKIHNTLFLGIGKIKLLTKEEEQTLGRKIQAGEKLKDKAKLTAAEKQTIAEGDKAKHDLVQANLRLAAHIAQRYTLSEAVEFEDLIQQGVLALYRAAEKFDPEKNFKFSTYATFWIRQFINLFLNDTHSPFSKANLPVAAARRKMHEGEELTADEKLAYSSSQPISIHAPTNPKIDISDTYESIIASPPAAVDDASADIANRIHQAAKTVCTEEERFIIEAHLGFLTGETVTFKDIAATIGDTAEVNRRKYHHALDKIKILINKNQASKNIPSETASS